jgi:uncharacterized membrane protein
MYRLKHQARSSIWLIPFLGLLAGLGLAVLTIAIDRAHHYGLVSHAVTGTPADVQTILSTAATALVTLTGVVLSLTLVAVQLAMGQFPPRTVGALLDDRPSQAAIALFAGTFSYAMLVTREVNDKTGGWLLQAADDPDPHWARRAIARDFDIDRYKVKRFIDQAA